jgi:hypothetical protein
MAALQFRGYRWTQWRMVRVLMLHSSGPVRKIIPHEVSLLEEQSANSPVSVHRHWRLAECLRGTSLFPSSQTNQSGSSESWAYITLFSFTLLTEHP